MPLNMFMKKVLPCLFLLFTVSLLPACNEKENLPCFSFDGATISYRAKMLDELNADGQPAVRIEYLSAASNGKTTKDPEDIINILTKKLYGFRGLRLQAGDGSYSVLSMSKDAEKKIWYSIVPVALDVPKDASLIMKYPVPGQSPSFERKGHTFTYEAYFLGEPSASGQQQIMIDFESAADGRTRLDRRELFDLLSSVFASEPLTLKVDGAQYPLSSLSASTYADQTASPPKIIPLSAYAIVEVPADTPRNSNLMLK